MTQILDLPGLLDLLGYADNEHVQLAQMPPGGTFHATVTTACSIPPATLDADQWFGVNPVRPVAQGRPGAADVTRLAAIWADLDVKPGGCLDFDTARQIIDDLATLLGTRPVALTMSGHGIQPYWAIENQPIADTPDPEHGIASRSAARAVLRQWGRLVAHAAERRGAGVDTVFDLPRILRRPGSRNLKDPANPAAVVTVADTGAPITFEQLGDVLAENGITTQDGDFDDPGQIVSAPADWQWGGRTCAYARKMIDGWARDAPDARHPWLVAQATRLAALHRAGCITQADHADAVQALAARFRSVLASGQARTENPGEIADALGWGIQQCAGMSDERMGREIGNARGMHGHDDQAFGATIIANIASRAAAPPTDRPRLTVVPAVEGALAIADPQPAPTVRRHTDDGNAHALIDAYGDVIRYDTSRGRWLTWTGYRWQIQPPGGGAVRELPKDIARRYVDSAGGNEAANKWGMKSLSALSITNTLTMASSDPRITVTIDQLDANPWVLNTPGGLVDLHTGAVRPATPDDLVTRTTNAVPDFSEPPPIWTEFLTTTFGADTELIGYVQRLAGLALIGQVREQILPFLFGSGANGKSTLLEALMWTMRTGDDGYAKAAPAEILMVRRHEGHPTELADLVGARLVVCSELEDGQRLAEARVKLLTGRDTISARFLYGQPFTYTPSHLIVLAGNHRPQAAVGGPALWRRIRAVPFAHTVPEELRDPELPDKLQQAAGHILAWAIRGAADYVADGMRQPQAVTAATKAYEQDQDTIGRFIEENIQLAPEGRETVKKIRLAYESWCMELGIESASAKRLTQELSGRFAISTIKSGSARFYKGLVLLDTDDDPEDNGQVTESEEPWFRK